MHDEADIERTPRDKSLYYDMYTYRSTAPSLPPVTYDAQIPRPPLLNTAVNTNNVLIITVSKKEVTRRLVSETGLW